jgi:ATP-dependent Clp protease adaptor protein ClpS
MTSPFHALRDNAEVTTAPSEVEETGTDERVLPDVPWMTVVWNDPVNLMSYVAWVFRSYFGYSDAKADKLMLAVHEEGRAVVSNGTREAMERDVEAMHSFGLWATLQKADAS